MCDLTNSLFIHLVSGHFGTRTVQHQDTSAPNNWCRSIRTLRHQFFVGAELSHCHFGLLPNCLKTKGNGQSKILRDRRHSQLRKYMFPVYPARWKSICSNCSKCHSDEISKYVLWEAYKYNHFAVAFAQRPIGIAYTFSGRKPRPRWRVTE